MTATIRRASARFADRADGRVTHHAFSFGQHYDPEHASFGPMLCHDDHLLGSGRGFDPHRHADLEVVSWVVSGALLHGDETGDTAVVEPGSVAVLSAGAGTSHAEHSAPGGPTRFVQVWLTPDERGTTPSYDVVPVDLVRNELVPVAAGDGSAPARVGVAGATFSVARLDEGATLALPDAPLVHVFVATGALTRSSLAEPLSAGDALLLTDETGRSVTAAVPTELLVWTFAG
ncbi:pirin family protein [Nocardioides sp. cx-173]|uniref:pirin family protein n=1 Tax=Nocardioides sp. cx-173 TaxID=2898796 RepID=UPI001E426E2E|nr:pirin family protein [Nocardioides sp. cx-173]MCD4523840.1 pirin family protein [Nocardioides sp. cx-173]UGB41840.1 pirin family protein [Nocardioides sp. cx-173]